MIPFKTACNLFILLLFSVLVFHCCVLFQWIDFRNVWGGRLSSKKEMYVFETVSICINAFLLYVVLQKASYVKQIFSSKFIQITLWVFVVLFGLNTIGNLLANNIYEKTIGTILTFSSAYLCFVISKR
jgi:hypothetical protein